MAKRELVQLAHVLNLQKHLIAGRFCSEKIDGERCVWDGGVTRGLYTDTIPWSNVAKDKKRTIATGLWTRRGKVIFAPTWFLDKLPKTLLDGELFWKRGGFQTLSSIVRNQSGTSNWDRIQYCVFDSPPPANLFADGNITDTMFKKELRGCYEWWLERATSIKHVDPSLLFQDRQAFLRMQALTEPCILHPQTKLPDGERSARIQLETMMEFVLSRGGEGLVIKSPNNLWRGERSWDLLKYKPFSDMEAEVVGYTSGRETDKGSKLLGKMGALICRIPAGQFQVSGFTDAERVLSGDPPAGDINLTAEQWASKHPDSECPDWITSSLFPRGSRVTLKYRELTDSGLLKEARYFRKFNP